MHGGGGAVRAEKGKASRDLWKAPDAAATMPSHEALWAREGDVMRRCYHDGEWSLLASVRNAGGRSKVRRELHGFDFDVVSENGTKRMVKR